MISRKRHLSWCLSRRKSDRDPGTYPLNDKRIRMRQLAVSENFRNIGIGKALVKRSEAIARDLGFTTITLHARESALDFYDQLGYRRCGDRFVEVNLPHWEMEKSLL
ncbi:MAG: GNAT family N-acetyltransferase [Candidatus Marinimicrobia bacterium]|nr:GNAT family N-acetyltransferase [Candidatus Neomarinimicrobiota bacterium]